MIASLPSPARLSSASLVLVLFAAACGSSTAGTGGATGTGGVTGAGGQCRAQMDCGGGDFCGADVLPPFCGGACDTSPGDTCQSDADCASADPTLICDRPCACFHGGAVPENRCTKGCDSDADCGPSLTCIATHRCQGANCAQPSDCTANFTCGSDLHCMPKPCTTDADCGDYCVNGRCSPVLGDCRPAVP